MMPCGTMCKMIHIFPPTVVKDTLEDRGVLGQIKARIRAEVFHALEEDTEPAPPLGNENMFINELIREYFEFNKYKYSLSVMLAGTPSLLCGPHK